MLIDNPYYSKMREEGAEAKRNDFSALFSAEYHSYWDMIPIAIHILFESYAKYPNNRKQHIRIADLRNFLFSLWSRSSRIVHGRVLEDPS